MQIFKSIYKTQTANNGVKCMNVFSYHIVRTSYLSALKVLLLPPKLTGIAGLVHIECMTAMTLGSAIFSPSRMLIKQLVVFAQWESEEAIDNFMVKHWLGAILTKGWHIRLK